MDPNKDYYATLGLTPSADAVVIRAAFKALAQRYHPDNSGIDAAQASPRMAEINEAYSVLNDPTKRAEYDRLRKHTTKNADTAFRDEDTEPTAGSPLDADCRTAIEFYPEIEALRAGLAKISWKVAEAFRARILGSKEFKEAKSIAARLESEFLSVYFGSNAEIIKFAKALILDGRRAAARDLNRAVNVLGPTTNPEKLIHVIRNKHHISVDPEGTWDWDSTGKRRGITARFYARQRGLDEEFVIIRIQQGDLPGFAVSGVYHVEIGDDGNPLGARPMAEPIRSSAAGHWALAAVLLLIVVWLIVASR